ncbi:MAG: glucose 1-dehydrogenase [Sedimentibacter sp.]|uniref:SDR family NAD(P)-dependent oxidoreductase n=1 Tax=Sedimentibacter sp. TaxID=1960295 RepID=UPI003158474A
MSILNGINLFDLKDKVVLVTGAGNGLGKGYSRVFAESGCKVACADINKEASEKTSADIIAEGGIAKSFVVDVTNIESINTLIEEIVKEFGKIDILVNNAGIEIAEPFFDVTPEHFDKINSVNIRGVYFVSQAVAKLMKKNGGGKIINIGSLGSYIGLAESSVYCSTKGAVIQLSKTIALELANDNIQVNCIAPGYFITPMTQPFYDDPKHRAWIEDRIPMSRWGTVADLAGPMLFLASSASNYITGQTVIVDGGWLAS